MKRMKIHMVMLMVVEHGTIRDEGMTYGGGAGYVEFENCWAMNNGIFGN